MIHASLFSGIGGPEVAAAMLGWDNAFHCEINPFGKAVLEYWFPNSKSYDDITKASFKEWRGRIDVLTGGFPCQPFSYAGKRGGRNDDRYLWPEMLRVIDEVRPAWVVGENVAGNTTMVEDGVLSDMGCDPVMFGEGDGLHRYQLRERFTIERICSDLEGLGYSVQPLLVPAAAVGAPHRRDRVFIVAHDADADGGDAVRGPGIVPRSRGTERLQERDEIREPGGSNHVRSEVQRTTTDTSGCGHPAQDEGGRIEGQRCEGYVLAAERGLKAKRTDGLPALYGNAADTASWGSGTLSDKVYARLADGDGPLRDGRVRDAAYTNSRRREEPILPGRETNPAEDGAGMDDTIKRFGRNGNSADSDNVGNSYGLGTELPKERSVPTQCDAESGRICKRLCEDLGLYPEDRWASFPTVSPVHRGNDGLPFPLDDLAIPATKWRTESLKAYGNAIVPQVMYRIFQAIEAAQ